MSTIDRASSIWATRLQREIKTLVSHQERSQNNELSILPRFVSVTKHTLNLEGGVCKVSFRFEVEKPNYEVKPLKHNDTEVDVSGNTKKKTNDNPECEENDSLDCNITEAKGEIELPRKEELDTQVDSLKDEVKEDRMPLEEGKKNEDIESSKDNPEEVTAQSPNGVDEAAEPPDSSKEADSSMVKTKDTDTISYALVELDASIGIDPDSTEESTHNNYPFQKPKAVLLEGASLFPPGLGVENGNEVEVDCDWTPSLHLVDAAVNVVLRIRESIRRGDPSGLQPHFSETL